MCRWDNSAANHSDQDHRGVQAADLQPIQRKARWEPAKEMFQQWTKTIGGFAWGIVLAVLIGFIATFTLEDPAERLARERLKNGETEVYVESKDDVVREGRIGIRETRLAREARR